MRLELHPDAAKNFDAKADELLTKLIPTPYERKGAGQFTPDIFVREVKFPAVHEGYSHPLHGGEIAKTFEDDEKILGLFDEGYKDLVRLSEQVQKTKTIRDKVSVKLLTDLIFKWIRDKYLQRTDLTMTQYVLPECEALLREVEIWVPVATLHVQSDIRVGKVTFKTITKTMVEEWLTLLAEHTVNPAAEVQVWLDEMRAELQGLAAATIKLFAEPQRASEVALAEADRAASIMRIFSPACLEPEAVSYCTTLGREHAEGKKWMAVERGRIVSYSDYYAHGVPLPWVLDDQRVAELHEEGLDIVSDILRKESPTEYEDALLDALLLYSKCAIAKDPAEKLIAILVALESMLLKDANEPIQQNLAERMAFLFDASAVERRKTKASVIRAYGLRSSFIHHGRGVGTDDLDALREFMLTAWTSFYALIQYSRRYTTKSQLFERLEELKMS